jgi:MazG family protein
VSNGTPPARREKASEAFAELVSLVHRLRAPGGCPWDAEQTHASIKNYAIEEAHELGEAIDRGQDREMCDELGDLLLQVLFHAEMASERGAFDIGDVIAGLGSKLVRRHPHVFADETVGSSADVVANWAKIKAQERSEAGADSESRSAIAGVPRAMPALLRAHRLGQKAAAVPFDWDEAQDVRAKLEEEMCELDSALSSGDAEAASAEVGDVIFTAASLARKLGRDAETLLQESLDRFERRFRRMEGDLLALGKSVGDATAQERDTAWDRAKLDERNRRS